MDKPSELRLLINSETPLIYVETWEEERVEAMLEVIASDLQIQLFHWTSPPAWRGPACPTPSSAPPIRWPP